MELTRKQEEGLKITLDRWRNGEKYSIISGYAGAGKTTLVAFIIAAMCLKDEEVSYIAYTGKAANVLKNRGCPGATTAHKLLYYAKLMPNGKYLFTAKRPQDMDKRIKVVVVDEVSMLPKNMWELLCSHNFFIIACGDPEQLPPIQDPGQPDQNNHMLDHPHVFLDEIMRQAQESEIIRLSMHVREGKPIMSFPVANEEVMIFSKSQVQASGQYTSILTWGDQILCATNKTRIALNQQMRNVYNRRPEPEIGDKIINLHNEWDIISNKENPLTNGIIGQITEMTTCDWDYPYWIRNKKLQVPILQATITGDEEGELFDMLSCDYSELINGKPSLTRKEEYMILKRAHMTIPLHFSYGYAITVWKAQGSQYPKVVLFDEAWPKESVLKRKYLYTGITRAENKLVVIQ